MYQDGRIHRGRIEGHAVLLGEDDVVARISKAHAEQEAQHAGHQGDDEVLRQYLSRYLAPGAAEGTAHANLADPLPQAALRHAAQVDGGDDEEDEVDHQAAAAFGPEVGLVVGARWRWRPSPGRRGGCG